ncbi:protein N-lysine methyltransferase METTL21A-like [Dendronephthya gigantea]|uniref:protein N-lysine methyltransferase METTL21A-like n=1 Tax=Dendronephthya gigantea TaxID=151771 RepID=UPI00106B8B9E|nr:protein N-lysine methyltransferase METTL21A-like [Dendronephthya gigantea]
MLSIVLNKLLFVIAISAMMSCGEKSSSKNNMELVVYEPPKLFTIFQTDSREFTFAGHTVNISQDWETNGVAAVVWDAALVLVKYLETMVDLTGKRVIELGAGTGLVGIVAGYLGAQVTITDRRMALDLAHDNVKRNIKNLNSSSVDVRELEWGQDVSPFKPPFDYILGADIVYIEDTFPQLLQTITELSDIRTIVLLSCKIRYKRDRNFLGLLNEKFEISKVHYDENVDIYIYKAVKRVDKK